MAKKNITIDQLTTMVQKGFTETAKKSEMDLGFKEVNKRLDRIENVLLKQHSERIEALEKRMHDFEKLLIIK